MAEPFDRIPRSDSSKYGQIEPGDEIVVTGISGRFPGSDTVQQLADNLYGKVDLVTADERRWSFGNPEIPKRMGKVNNIEKFDALFFGVHYRLAHAMEPMGRILLEHTYEAVIDAGMNPKQLHGTNTGVFLGCCNVESEKAVLYEKPQAAGVGIVGTNRAMLANRISYWLGIHGPSFALDSACSSSLVAVESAYRAIRSGTCDAAIVCGSGLLLHPAVALQFSRLGVLAMDGKSKTFDDDASGYARSETCSVIFLQKARDARRVYATLVHAKVNSDGYKGEGITFPSTISQSAVLRDCYNECGLPPTVVDYLEVHGTGTRVGDPEEANAVDRIFSPGRTTPLRVGSVKSNLGHSEAASGMCSIAKVVIAMHNNLIPPNLHFKRPRKGVKCLEEGRLKVVTEPTTFDGSYVGINSFGFGGTNAHLLLKAWSKKKVNKGTPKDDLPRIVCASGRTEDAVATILNDIINRPVDVEYIRLFHAIHSEDITGHLYRGYTIVGRKNNERPIKHIQHYPGGNRQIWFVFSGMGSQWPGMGVDLMIFPVFAEAVRKCDAVLKPRGVDIMHILTNTDPNMFDNILNSFVGIATIQIGLVDLLRSVGIFPDGIIGHSVGELGCAYSDGCFTAEEMVLAAYSRGLASLESELIHGSMAAVGLGYKDIKDLCPPDVSVACHNGADSCTISGPAKSIQSFVAELQGKNVFAKEVLCSNIAYHSKYIAPAGKKLLTYLREVIKKPRERSSKWLSTSVPESEWSAPGARYSSAEYHTNNLLNPVLFEETARLIPKDAVTIEIAPHGLLQAILKRSLGPDVVNVPLTKRGHPRNSEFLLQALGQLYTVGLQPQLAGLYPTVQFPVSSGTPMISHLVKWDHSEDWYVACYKDDGKLTSGERTVEVTLSEACNEYLVGHTIDGRNLYPATGYLTLVWETLGMMRGVSYTDMSVVFNDVKFLRATNIPKEGVLNFNVMIQKGSGKFEVVEGGAAIVSGRIRALPKPSEERIKPELLYDIDEPETVTGRDAYKEFRLHGYQYSGMFRAIQSVTVSGLKGRIAWQDNWVTFMDNLLQIKILQINDRSLLCVPTAIEKLVIDVTSHSSMLQQMPDQAQQSFQVRMYQEFETIVAGGVEIRGLKMSPIARRKPVTMPVVEDYRFVPHRDLADVSLREAMTMCVHLALENTSTVKAKTLEFVDADKSSTAADLATPLIMDILGNLPVIQSEPYVIAKPEQLEAGSLPESVIVTDLRKFPVESGLLLAIACRLLSGSRDETLKQSSSVLPHQGFLVTREDKSYDRKIAAKHGFDVVLEKRVGPEAIVMLRKRLTKPVKTKVVRVNNTEFSWLERVKADLVDESGEVKRDENVRLVIVGEKDHENGLLGFVNCLRREPGGEMVRGVLVQNPNAPTFSLEDPLYADQLRLDLAVNVLREGNVWGSYRHFLLPFLESRLVSHAWTDQLVRGDVSSICLLEGHLRPNLPRDDLVYVYYASLNFRDIMIATGKLSMESFAKNDVLPQSGIGMEYAGVNRSGQRLMGMGSCRCMSNLYISNQYLTWEVPDDWSLEEAATVPCVYSTCYYALYDSGKMKKGDRVLIHSGSGAVGQAAINLALHEGCEVFTTVGTPEKRRFIRERYPCIDDDHIGNSRDCSFEQMVMQRTGGEGVDIVLNSLAEEKLLASVRCLRQGGRFLEIGKYDFVADNPLGLNIFLREISFHSVMLDNIFEAPLAKRRPVWKRLVDGLKCKAVKPLVRTVFEKDEIEKAVRYMASGKHIGKVLIKMRDEEQPLNSPVLARPRYTCLEDKSYVIFGGLGGFGLELAQWLVRRYAKNLVLVSRGGIKNGYQWRLMRLWQLYGIRVEVVSGKDVTKPKDVESILKTAEEMGPIDSIFNLAVNLRDSLFVNQTSENFVESFATKAWLTRILDRITRKSYPNLRHFVVFSSVSCGRGNAGQTNYGMSNSVMERICEKRVQDGLPGLAVQWGAVGDVGLVAEMQDEEKEVVIGGTLPQKITSCLEELDGFLRQHRPVVSSIVVAEKRVTEIKSKSSVEVVADIMGVKDLKTAGAHTTFAELGMDSMMAVEINQILEREYEIFVTSQDIRTMTFTKLAELSQQDKQANKDTTSVIEERTFQFLQVLGNDGHFSKVCYELSTKRLPGRPEVFLLPGVEGSAAIFETLAPHLKCPATSLQVDIYSDTHSSVDKMADYLIPHILERDKKRRNYVIVGHSFGSLVGIEIVRRLEAKGMKCQLVLIDGAPELMIYLVQNFVHGSDDDDRLQDTVLLHLLNRVVPERAQMLTTALAKCTTWEQRLEAFTLEMDAMKSTKMEALSVEYQKGVATILLKHVHAIKDYLRRDVKPINAEITLLRPKQLMVSTLQEDYGLHKYTRDKVKLYDDEGDHVSIVKGSKVAAVINGEMLEEPKIFKGSPINGAD